MWLCTCAAGASLWKSLETEKSVKSSSSQMITIVLLTSVHADKSPAIRVEEIHMVWVRFHTMTLLHNQPILASFLLPEGRKGNKYGRSGQQIWVGMRNKYGGRVEPLMCWMEFSIHASGTFQSAERSSIAMELLPRDLQRWYRFLSFLDAQATRGPILFSID